MKRMTATRPSVAVAYSGDFRALDVVHESVARATASLNGDCAFFFWLERPTATRATTCVRPRSDSTKEGQRWTQVSDAHVLNATLRQLYRAASVHYAEYNSSDAGMCFVGVSIQSPEQYDKLQRVFRAIVAYERVATARFDWLVRLRTDMLFLGGLPNLASLAADRIYVPVGHVNPSVPVNDHLVLAPRALAAGYFDAADELSCNASLFSSGKRVRTRGGGFLADRLHNVGVRVEHIDVGYVLVRGLFGAACWRLKSHNRTTHWWHACLALSRTIPVYCRDDNGTGHPHRFGPVEQDRAANRQMLSLLHAPRCAELPGDGQQMQREVFEGQDWPPARESSGCLRIRR